uniref:Uncharacterized protein n=1 Tax=Arion vulgaris TaxID=1028688 RepID=A0A0B6ZT51_9EUPU
MFEITEMSVISCSDHHGMTDLTVLSVNGCSDKHVLNETCPFFLPVTDCSDQHVITDIRHHKFLFICDQLRSS